MFWSSFKHCDDDATVWLDLVGDLCGVAAETLRAEVVQTIVVDLPDRLFVDLDSVSGLDMAGVTALMSGYLAAIDYGVWYRVAGAHGRVREVLHTTGTLDVLADSDDLGGLLLAVALCPAPDGPGSRRGDRHK